MIVGNFLNTFFCFSILAILSMTVTYIAQIRGKLTQLVKENLDLLDKMHEGLIVILEKDKSLQFASQPAVRLLKSLPFK